MKEKKVKYLIFDYGDVLVYPVTKNWFITPSFYRIIDKENIDMDALNEGIKKASAYISAKMITEKEEYEAFKKAYEIILNSLGIDDIEEKADHIAFEFAYSNEKYKLYSDVIENLKRLSKDYKLLMLSDNWPCAHRLLKFWRIYDYFDKVYISSEYECQKKDKVFFDYVIKDYSILRNQAIFVDDKEELLDIAKEKGFEVLLMDRKNTVKASKYKKINSLKEI